MTDEDNMLRLKILYTGTVKSWFYSDLTNNSLDVFLKNILLKCCFLFISVKIFETPIRAYSKPLWFLGYLHIPQPISCFSQFSHTRRQRGPKFKLNESPRVLCAKIGPVISKGDELAAMIPTTDSPKKFWSEKFWHLSLQLRRANKNKITGFFSFRGATGNRIT